MHRAWKRSIGALAAAGALAWAAPASAFHAGNVFDKPAGAGGGAGIFYTGADTERGWDCTSCHTNAAGKIRVTLAADPPSLLQSFRYEPGKTYVIAANLDGEHLGTGASNFNSLAIAFVDGTGAPAGEFSGYAADEYYAGRTTLVSAGQRPGERTWSFRWTAPAAASTEVRLHVAAVDGNGAGGAGGTLTDPFGDDVYVGAVTLRSSGSQTARNDRAPAAHAMLGVACVFCLRRRRGTERGGRR